jgi:hypothetical protein
VGVVFKARVLHINVLSKCPVWLKWTDVYGVKVEQLLLVGQVFITNSIAKF